MAEEDGGYYNENLNWVDLSQRQIHLGYLVSLFLSEVLGLDANYHPSLN